MAHLSFLRDDLNEAETGDVAADERRPATETLAIFALEAALSPAQRRRIAVDPAFALIVQVPAADWVEPVRDACTRFAEWGFVAARSGASRSEDRPDRGNDRVASSLSRGDRVLGVSQSPARFLPSALLAAADLHVRLPGATDAVVARVVQAATGRRPKLPPGIARGLDFFEVAAAVRGATAQACVARLAAAARSKATADPSVGSAADFATLVGYGEAHAWGTRLLDDLATWRTTGEPAFHRLDRHVALSSAPGLGKSSFVRALAKAAGVPLVATSVASWFTGSDGYLGGVLKAWDAAYANACALAPSILLIDEADSIPSREKMDDRAREWWTPLCTSILLGFDALDAPGAPEVCIIAATNHGARLDPALIRPGRLGRVIEIKPPCAAELALIFRQHLDDGELPDLDLGPLGILALGATGAQVAGWVSEARAVARAAGRPLRAGDLFERVAPPDRRSAADLRRSAYHEAGHGLGFERTGSAHVVQVDLVQRRDSVGATSAVPGLGPSPTRKEIEGLVVALLSGRAAEIAFLGEPSAGAGGDVASDLARATTLLAGAHASLGLGEGLAYRGAPHEVAVGLTLDPRLLDAVERDLARLGSEALALVEANRAVVEAVAELLVEGRVVSGDTLRALIAEADQTRAARDGGHA